MNRYGAIADRIAGMRTAVRLAPKGMLIVELSADTNPDFGKDSWEGQVKIKPIYETVRTMADASKAVRRFIEKNNLGGGNFTGGRVWDDREEVAHVSYNGRVWEPGKYPTPEIDVGQFDRDMASSR